MRRVDDKIYHMTRLHSFARSDALFEHTVWLQSLDISGIAYNSFYAKMVKNCFGFIKTLVLEVWNYYRLAMVRINVKSKPDSCTEYNDNDKHRCQIIPQVFTLEFSYEFRRCHYIIFYFLQR